jgi:hypothetical protein
MLKTNVRQEARAMTGEELAHLFENKWGAWRRFISANPLTGSWIAMAIGLVIGEIAGHLAWPI